MKFQRVFSGAPWESQVGYCRAVRAGNLIVTTGTAPVADDGSVFAPGDAYRQTQRCLEIIQRALRGLGANMRHIIRTRMYVTDISRWAEFGRAHRECFADHPPCATMVEVKSLIDPAMLIEIEVEAVCADESARRAFQAAKPQVEKKPARRTALAAARRKGRRSRKRL